MKFKITDERKHNPKGSNLPRDTRFKDMPFYDRGTGESVFLGPGSYNADECFKRLKQVPTPNIMVITFFITFLETDWANPRQSIRWLALHNGWRSDKI